jgi:chromosome segregation ATPase
MGQSRPPQQSSIASLGTSAVKLAAFRGGSTAQIWERLCRSLHEIPDRLANVSRLVSIEAETAGMRKDTIDYQSHLGYSLTAIQSSLTHLEKASEKREEATKLYQRFVQEFIPLRAEANDRAAQREKFILATTDFAKEKDVQFKEIIQAMIDEKPKHEINALLNALEKKLGTLVKQIKNLNMNEHALQQKLDRLHIDTTKTAKAIGVKIEIPLRPGIEPKAPTLS